MKKTGLMVVAAFLLAINCQAQSVDNVWQQAQQYFQARDWQNAASLYEKITQQEPQNNAAWFRLGMSLHAQQKFAAAIPAFEQAEKLTHAPGVMYNLACAHARAGNNDTAFVWLEQAIAAKFPQLKLIQTDEDLATLRTDPRYVEINHRIEKILKPCAANPAARQFDFWIGEWDVKAVNGQQVGTNSVQLILGECVLLENWTGGYGDSGKSLNTFNQNKGYWQQTWMDDRGNVAEFVNGHFLDSAMRFDARQVDKSGKVILRKLTFHLLAPDKVRQHAEQSQDDGKTWTTQYDFTYYRKKTVGKNQTQ